ncbi:hypothetical protein JCM3766R1_004713 [Sporobolomyces carnicolor]
MSGYLPYDQDGHPFQRHMMADPHDDHRHVPPQNIHPGSLEHEPNASDYQVMSADSGHHAAATMTCRSPLYHYQRQVQALARQHLAPGPRFLPQNMAPPTPNNSTLGFYDHHSTDPNGHDQLFNYLSAPSPSPFPLVVETANVNARDQPYSELFPGHTPQLSSPNGTHRLEDEEARLIAAMEKEKSGWQALSQEVAEIHAELDGGCTNVEIQHLKESCAVLDRKLSAAQKKYDRIKRDLDEIRRRRDGSLLTDQATNSYLQFSPHQPFVPLQIGNHNFGLYPSAPSASSNMGHSSGQLSPSNHGDAGVEFGYRNHITPPQFQPRPRLVTQLTRLTPVRRLLANASHEEAASFKQHLDSLKVMKADEYRRQENRSTWKSRYQRALLEYRNWCDVHGVEDGTLPPRRLRATRSNRNSSPPAISTYMARELAKSNTKEDAKHHIHQLQQEIEKLTNWHNPTLWNKDIKKRRAVITALRTKFGIPAEGESEEK